jgi:hypothetical protein
LGQSRYPPAVTRDGGRVFWTARYDEDDGRIRGIWPFFVASDGDDGQPTIVRTQSRAFVLSVILREVPAQLDNGRDLAVLIL